MLFTNLFILGLDLESNCADSLHCVEGNLQEIAVTYKKTWIDQFYLAESKNVRGATHK